MKRARNWVELARVLGVTPQAVTAYRKQPGCPAGHDIAEWKAWMTDNGKGVGVDTAPPEINQLRREKLAREVEKLDLQIARERRRVVEMADVDKLLLHVATRQKQHLYATLAGELPTELEGLSAARIRLAMVRVADEICDVMRQQVDAWREN